VAWLPPLAWGREPRAIKCMQAEKTSPIAQPSHNTPHEAKAKLQSYLLFLGRASLFNCFWLIVPILVWNLLFTLPGKYSSAIFWHNIPPLIAYGENIFRTAVILFPLLLSLSVRSRSQRLGLLIYAVGLVAYFASWLALMWLPESAWSTSALGFLAPTYTPILWAVGIGLVGERLHWRGGYRPRIYIVLAVLFTAFHVSHAILVFTRGA
jgi:hypothetical protein